MKLGLVREYKIPEDIRVPLTPVQCQQLVHDLDDLDVVVEPYAKRCFNDSEYSKLGVKLKTDLKDCDVLMGVKEVPIERLLSGKTYLFFSHTIKMQTYNRKLLKALLERNITMIDYEVLMDSRGERIIGFGRWAGIVGAHYALLMIGKKLGAYSLKPASQCRDRAEMESQYRSIKFPPCKIVVTGNGRVGRGAVETLEKAGIACVSPEDFLSKEFDYAVYTVLGTTELYRQPDGSPVNKALFHKNPATAINGFSPYAKVADALINGIYWDYRAVRLFETPEIGSSEFRINVIADVTCDVKGSVPITLRQTSIDKPYIGIDRSSLAEVAPFSPNSVDVMAVGNLPNELPRDASEEFGRVLQNQVIPELTNITSTMLQKATICTQGKLTPEFAYLQEWVELGD